MARRKHNAAVKRKLIAKGNNNVKMDRNADLKSYAGKEIRANRKYKDTVFRMLFSDRENLLSLYNAVNGSNYENSDALEIVTLENAVYNHKSLYSSALQKIPAPNFIVFYNGTEREEDYWINYLSESYENLSGEPNLELKVLTLNINEGHNRELMEQCQSLREYAQYVAKVREYARESDLDTAVEQAVDDCIQNGVLAEFLRKHKSEVIAMSIFEYDKEEEERKLREAEYEAGYNSGKQDGYNSGKQDGYNSGKQDGYNSGKQDGFTEGKCEIIHLMFDAGESLEKIAQYTGYKVEELKNLLKK